MKFIFFVCTNLVATLKFALGNIFKAFMVGVFYAATHSGFEREDCPGGEILQKEEEREHKDSEKSLLLQRMISTRKGGGDICW